MENKIVRKSIAIAGLVSLLAGAVGASYHTNTQISFADGPEGGATSCWVGYSPKQTYSHLEQKREIAYIFGMQINSKVMETNEHKYPCFKQIREGEYELLVSIL